jgi:UDP-N-acetyl-2-amino-2-deoxyglucuronate dehydrogenase
MKAIRDTNNNLCVAADISDSVGVIDSYFPQASFFTETERFDRHIDKLRHTENKLDYLSVCTPNYLHDAHIRLGLRNDCDVICEKPLVVNYKNLRFIERLSQETNKNVYCILQLRLHEEIIKLKRRVEESPPNQKFNIDLTYITSRGLWYDYSWKADEAKSGGLLNNIGVHFFDMLMWIFGGVTNWTIERISPRTVCGTLSLERATVRWFLSYDRGQLPTEAIEAGKRTYRSIKIEGKELEFSDGFTELHTKSYEKILKGEGYTIKDVKPSIKLITNLRKELQNEKRNKHLC